MDTVIIKIFSGYKLEHFEWFRPELSRREYYKLSESELRSKHFYLRKFKYEPPYTKGYMPRIEIFEQKAKGFNELIYVLKIEFSVPKLMFGNSIQEVSENDKDRIFKRLQSRLNDNGIIIHRYELIASARVFAVHFCKNIILPHEIQMTSILRELKQMDMGKAYDVTSKSFKNGGKVLNIYTGYRDFAIYEKIADSYRPRIKRTDKNWNEPEREMIERFHLQKREIFRYEYRIKRFQIVQSEINKYLHEDKAHIVTFSDLFTAGLFKDMVLGSWRKLLNQPINQLALLGKVDTLDIFEQILFEARKKGTSGHSLNAALTSYGLIRAIKELGAKEVTNSIFRIWNDEHPERLKKKISIATELINNVPFLEEIQFVNSSLVSFELINRSKLNMGV